MNTFVGYNFKFGWLDSPGGGGAGGYTGHGGSGASAFFSNFSCAGYEAQQGRGGAATGSWASYRQFAFASTGGGVGICGMKNDPYTGTPTNCYCVSVDNFFGSLGFGGRGGSCGGNGCFTGIFGYIYGACYGGGVPFSLATFFGGSIGACGAVRIIWGNPTCCRAFPCCNTDCAPGGNV